MGLTITFVDLAGSVALLLWGIRMVQTGIQRAFGAKLRSFLAVALKDRFKAFIAGIGVTAILQSSTATGLMVSGFAAGGLVGLVPALAVMLGANVGTTLIVQALSFDVAEVAPALILVGVLMFQRATAGARDFGRVLIGLGLVLMALHQLVALLTPYEDVPSLRVFLGAISSQPILDVILAAAFTWAAHSSVATILLIMSLATRGTVPPDAAFALVLGANLGTAVNPVLEGSAGGSPSARRLPLGNLINRLIGVLIALVALPYLGRWMMAFEPNSARAVADFHTAFNLVLAAVFFPILKPYAALLTRWLPNRISATDPSKPLYLDPGAREEPMVALGAAAREALRMTDVLETMLEGFRDTLEKPHRRRIGESKRLDDIVDKLNGSIKTYLLSIDRDRLSDGDYQRITEILTFTTNVEHAADIVDRDLLGAAAKSLKRGVAFSGDSKAILIEFADGLLANVRRAASLLITEDVRAARLLATEKETFRDKEASATAAHFALLRSGNTAAEEISAVHLDLLRAMKSLNSHLVAAAAYPILERSNELLPTRMRLED